MVVPGRLSAQSNVVNGQGVMTSPGGTEFLIYTPPGYNASIPAPLLINLHGQGQINPNPQWPGCFSIECLRTQGTDATPAYLIHQGQWPAPRPFIVVSPQLKRDYSIPNIGDQDWIASYIDEVVEYVKTIRTINLDKIYIMGLSLGGQGCMIYSAAYPNKVAAMVPMCGRTYDDDPESDDVLDQACSLANIPMWLFHGTEDLLLSFRNATRMDSAINACPNPGSLRPHVTLLNAIDHGGTWNPIYNLSAGYPIYDWLLQFTRNSTVNVAPTVSVGADKKFLTTDGSLYLFSEYFDADGSVTSVSWSKTTQDPALTLEQTNTGILKVSNLQAGTFQFRLTVTDNLGATNSDDITVQLLSTAGSNNHITGFRLTNAANNNSDIGPLVNEQFITKSALGTTDLNVRATIANGATGSVVFRVDSHQYTRLVDNWTSNSGSSIYVYPHNNPPYGWKILPGDHVVCATPNTDSFGNGADGISKCVKFSVLTQPMQNYYPKSGQDISLLNSWGTETNGNGTSPTSFQHSFQIFNINKAATQSGALTISGNESALWVRSGGEMTVSSNFTGVINVEGDGIVNVNTSQPVVFGTISPASTIRFDANALSIPAKTYGNLTILGAGTSKTLGSGATIVAGNLLIDNQVTVNGDAGNTSHIQLTGDLTLQETNAFNPVIKFSTTLSGGQPHGINLSGTKAAFNQLNILGNSVVSVSQGTIPATLEFGSATGGGLVIQNGSELDLGKNYLTIIGSGTLNNQNQTGRIAFNRSKLSVTSQAAMHSNLYTKTTMDTVSAVITNLTGGGALFLRDSLFVVDSVKTYNGTIHANGLLTLVSSTSKTASISRVEGTGNISGAVRFHRFIRPGRLYRYLSFPVQNVKVSDLQKYVDVTGPFTGASTGPGLSANPSLFYYQEPAGWLPYPTASSTEEFSLGRGYSVFVRKAEDPTLIKVAGEVHIGDFAFQLNAGSTNPNLGWSLVGNPYAAPIQWEAVGWQSMGINSTIYVRDNEVKNGRYLAWDGEIGDEEFAGLIAQGQSFWVKADDPNSTPSLTVQENAKSGTQATFFRTKQAPSSTLTISLNHDGLTDRTFLKFNDRADLKFDAKIDGVKKRNGYYNLATFTADSVMVAIKNMPDTCSTSLSLSVEDAEAGTYYLNFSGTAFEHREFILLDHHLDSLILVKPNDGYVFQVTGQATTYGNQRFKLLATVEIPQPEISIQDGQLVSSVATGNQWLLDGEEIPGATQSVYVPLVSGQYQVRVLQSSCTKTSTPYAYVVTGAELTRNVYELFPNPAQHRVTIKGVIKPIPYTLFNTWGQAIQTGQLSLDFTTINLDTAPGLYILSLEGESGTHRLKLFIKK